MREKWLLAFTPDSAWREEQEQRFRDWARSVAAAGSELEWLSPQPHREHSGSATQPTFCAFLTLRVEDAAEAQIEAPPGMSVSRFRVSEELIFDRMPGTPGRQTPGVKKTTLWRARPDLDAASWQARYRAHAKLVPRLHASAARYRQNLVEDAPAEFPYDAISELWWEHERDLIEHFYASEEARRLVAEDTQGFIDIPSALQVVTHHACLPLLDQAI